MMFFIISLIECTPPPMFIPKLEKPYRIHEEAARLSFLSFHPTKATKKTGTSKGRQQKSVVYKTMERSRQILKQDKQIRK